MKTVPCASCAKLMPLANFGLTEQPSAPCLCLDCYDEAIAEARATYYKLFPDIRHVVLSDDISADVETPE